MSKNIFVDSSGIRSAREEEKKRKEREAEEKKQQMSRLELGTKKLFKDTSITWFIGTFLTCAFIWSSIIGLIMQITKLGYHKKYIVLIELIPTAFSTLISAVFTLIITLLTFKWAYTFRIMNMPDVVVDPFNGVEVAIIPYYGSAHWQYEDETKRCFFRAELPEEVEHNLNILGEGVFDHQLYSLRNDLVSMNKHLGVFGTSGSGKSATFITPMIYQNIMRGDSMIITDTKGDLCSENRHLLRKYGYTVKILNLKAKELMFSDGCDFLKPLKDDDVKAAVLANTITLNTERDKSLDYWAKNELNLLKALLLYVANDETRKKTGNATLAEVYNILSTMKDPEISALFYPLDDDHPAKSAFNIYDQITDEKIRGQICNGLAIRLSILGNKWAKQIVASDDISFIAPMKKKCAYFVIIDDQDDTFKFIATLFFASLLQEMSNYFDAMKQAGRGDECLEVNFLLDEFAATGSIPRFDKAVANVRSRGIGITIVLQDKGQLDDMYGENLASSILNNMSMKVLLKTSDPNTAKYFSSLLGIETIKLRNGRHQRHITDFFRMFPDEMESDGWGKREVMLPDELISMDNDHLVACISGFRPVRLRKFLYFRHPMFKECKKYSPRQHYPRWRKRIDKERAAQGLGPIYIEKGFDYEENVDDITGTMKEAMDYIDATKAEYEADGREYTGEEIQVEYEEAE